MTQTPTLIIRSLGYIKQKDPRLGEAFDDLLTGHNNVAKQLGTNPTGPDVTPSPISQLQVQHIGNGQIDMAITDNSSVSRAVNYYVDYSQDPSFTSPYTHALGPTRNSHSLTLPNGTWYFQGYSQYPAGGAPSKPIAAPAKVVITGAVSATLFPSQSSGTGTPKSGGGIGAGKVISR